MERVREGRRGGNGPLSAPRRARTSGGFKDITGVEEGELMGEVHSSRLRERLKKETSSLYSVKRVISGSGVSHSRTKRKRQEVQIQPRSSPMDEGGNDASDGTDIGLSEDDDDPPPPTIPKWPGKPKLQTKLEMERIAVDMLAVPRKARSAMVKRAQELPIQNIEVIACIPSPAPASPRQASPSNVLSSSSNIATKRTLKSSGSKSRSSKVPKTANSLSENEVEVAEALSDFARLMETQVHPPAPEAAVEVKPNCIKNEHSNSGSGTPISLPGSVGTTSAPLVVTVKGELVINGSSSSPLQASEQIIQSSPVVYSAQRPLPSGEVTAPKRKRPRVRPRQEDEAYNLQTRSLANARAIHTANAESLTPSKDQIHIVSRIETAVISATNVLPHLADIPPVTDASHSPRDNEVSLDDHQRVAAKTVVPEDLATELETSSPNSKQNSQLLSSLEENALPGNSSSAHPPAGGVLKIESSSCIADESINLSSEIRQLKSPPASDLNSPGNAQMNLMASPEALSTPNREQTSVISAPEIFEAEGNGNVDIGTPVKIPWLEKEQQRLKENNLENAKEKQRDVQEQKPTLEEGTFSGFSVRMQETKEALKDEEKKCEEFFQTKLDGAPKLPWDSVNTEKTADKSDFLGGSSAMPSSLSSSASESASRITIGTTGDAPTVPVTFNFAGWPQGLPPIGYYGSAAAAAMAAAAMGAWSGVSCLAGASMSDEKTSAAVQLPPYLMKPPQLRKRCSTHVYIAHLIAIQQCIARQSFFSNPYGSSSNFYRASSHSLNPSFAPFDAVLGQNAEFFSGSTVPGISAADAIASGGFSDKAATDRAPESAAFPASLEAGEKQRQAPSPAESASKRQFTVQQLLPTQQPSTTAQAGLRMLFPPSAATAGVGSGVAGASNMTGSNANVTAASGTFFSALNRDGVIQQNNLSYSFPSHHFAPLAFSGTPYLVEQQLVHPPPQQTQSLPDIVAGLSQKQAQGKGVGSFLHPGNGQQQQQPPTAPQPQSPAKLPPVLHQESEKEGYPESDNGSARRNFPPLQRDSDGQQSNNLASNQSTESQVFPGRFQDFDFMTPLSAKQATKAPQNKASVRSQIQQQSSQSPQQQQQAAVVRQHGTGSAVSMSLKGIEAQASQMYGMPYRISSATQGLEALGASIGRGSSTLQFNSKASAVQNSKMYEAGFLSKTSAGPGPLGLAPVAAVMAPQGHAMLQNMMDLARNYTQHQQLRDHLNGQSSHSIPQTQQQQQQQHSLQSQRAVARVEEARMLLDGNFGDCSTGRDTLEDRNLSVKRAATVPSRVDLDMLSNLQGSPGSANGDGPTHSQMAGILATLGHSTGLSHLKTPTSVSIPVGAQPVNHQSKRAGIRAKGVSSSKIQGQGSNLGQSSPTTQGARQRYALPNTQVKVSQRASVGSTARGPQDPAVLAAAMPKTQGQQLRTQPALASTTAASQIPSSTSAACASPPIASHQSPVTCKSSCLSTGKNASNGKGIGALPQKPSGGHGGKRLNAMQAQTGTVQTAQNLPSKSSHQQHQQHQQLSQSLQHFSSLPASVQQQHSYMTVQHSSSNQMQQQPHSAKHSFQMGQHTSIQQQLLHSQAQQQPVLQQQSALEQPLSGLTSQSQHQLSNRHLHASHQLLLQQQPQSSLQTNLSHLQSLPVPTVSNSDGESQALMMGASAVGQGANHSRITSDSNSLNQVATTRGSPLSTSRSSTNSTQGNSPSHRQHITHPPASIHFQLAPSNGTRLGQSQAMNPLFYSVAGPYMQATANPGTPKSSIQKNLSERPGPEPMNAFQTQAVSAVLSAKNAVGSPHVQDGKQQAVETIQDK
ncbi:hypothetical protein O6H91_08G041100 [Diphasiastrum complanatum]|uniref:Uncharacterized protein n=3 Tax=Diphasiastrum complanatum TaxID=34168 RepID=A0ACC2CWU5_DIPCM|nr:hypothetical protein O6H91_08G041100 [Diphasiastrum complanatum]KAJ7546466.1 hypothetical protein O6H91_08G041100 [Diphasiastrum complanatum]